LITPQSSPAYASPSLIVLLRNINQLKVALQADIKTIYYEFENPRNYGEAVKIFREWRHSAINSVPSPQYLCSITSDI
jgi:putative protease